MAQASTDPTVRKPLTEADVNKRRDILAARIKERDELREKKTAFNNEINAQLRLLDEQTSTLACEIRDRQSWVPAEPLFDRAGVASSGSPAPNDDEDFDDQENARPLPAGVTPIGEGKPGKKKRAAKRT